MTEIYGWTGKILRIDLTRKKITTIDTMKYARMYIGGVGIAARIAWEEIGPEVGPFDPENRLMIMVGPLTGTLASGSCRVEVLGIAPQQHPPCFSRSGMGGHWGPELKYAGFDGIIIQGRAEKPVYIWIDDGDVEILSAKDIWGLGTYATTKTLRSIHGDDVRVISCGPAGENLCRIAIIQTETENAAGQGGFGAVMGSKNLKAIAVRGSGGVKIARPKEFLSLCLKQSREGNSPHGPKSLREMNISGPNFRRRKCGFCLSVCSGMLWMDVQGEFLPALYTTEQMCYGFNVTSERGRIEARVLVGNYGINGWEVSYGIIPWLQLCKQHNLIKEIDGMEIPAPEKPIRYLRDCAPVTPEFLAMLLRKIAYREGPIGDALADGACYAAERLFGGKGKPLLDRIYPRHAGQVEHWAGHWGPGGNIYWPMWLTTVLQWCVDTRDPASDTSHSWTSHVQRYLPRIGPYRGPIPPERIREISMKVYGDPNVLDPSVEYDPPEARAIPAIWHTDMGMVVDSLILCDSEYPRIFSSTSKDGMADIELMAKIFSACTGVDISMNELRKAGERIFNLLRAIDVRNYGRSRRIDESTIDVGFNYPGKDDGKMLDKRKFLKLLEKYYELRGWNKESGWPTREKLEELGLKDVADELERIGRIG